MYRLKTIFISFAYGVVFPIVVSTMTYFGYFSRYNNYFNVQEMPKNYFEGIYRYRFLSRDIIVWLLDFSSEKIEMLKKNYAFIGHVLDKMEVSNFYLVIFSYNTLFYALACLFFRKILFRKKYDKLRELLYFLMVFTIGISQFVVTPYDMASIFFLSVSILISLKLVEKFSVKLYVLFLLILVVATLNRETSALHLSFYAAVLLNDKLKNIFRKERFTELWIKLSLPFLCYTVIYGILRIYFMEDGNNQTFIMNNFMIYNFTEIRNILGMFFYLILTYLSLFLAETDRQRNNIRSYIFFSFPYIFIIVYAGILWEIRLVLPLLVGQIILAEYKTLKLVAE